MFKHVTIDREGAKRVRTLGALALLVALLVALTALAPAKASAAGTAKFTATFEAERSSDWNAPRTVSVIDCHGEHYVSSYGDDSATIKTRKAFKVLARSVGRSTMWQFGPLPNAHDPLAYGIEAHGVSTRNYTHIAGTTGGWCGGPETLPPPKTDCGTRLPVYQLVLTAGRGEINWTASYAQSANEKYDFYNCTTVVPDGMHASSFPELRGKFNRSAVFNRHRKRIVISANKKYGPTVSSSNLTSKGHVSWKLTLTRVK